jgi:hypothetical protein
MRFIVFVAFFIIMIISEAGGNSSSLLMNKDCNGIWSAHAQAPYSGPNFFPGSIASPNGKFSIKASNEKISFIGEDNLSTDLNIIINPPLMEVLWSPNSKGFVVNVSDGGLVGTWDFKLYTIVDGHPVFHDLQKLMQVIASELPPCDPEEAEVPNIGASAWLNNSDDLLVVAEVPPHSSCKNMGAIQGFRVSVATGKIIDRISESDLYEKWADSLGCRFQKKQHK